MRPIRIKEIRLNELDNFARPFLERPGPDDILPISPQRVLAHTHNPCARPDDTVLLAAFEGNICIGYHGLLPGLLRHDNGRSRVFWATTFYVSENHRGQGIGRLLISKIKASNVDFAVTGMTRAAEKTYLQSGLKTFGPLVYYQLQLKKSARNNFFHQILKRFLSRRRLHRQIGDFQQFYYKRIDRIGRELKPIKAPAGDAPTFHRGIGMVNWMLKYPWVLSSDAAEVPKENYHFAWVRDIFKHMALEIHSRRDNALKGFMVLSVSIKKGETILKILDYYVKDLSDLRIILGVSLKLAAYHLADRIDIPAEFQDYFQNKFFKKYTMRKKKRAYAYYSASATSPLSSSIDQIALNYCDGDTAFT
jgi:GNAT superfamily N-acetyltransferase